MERRARATLGAGTALGATVLLTPAAEAATFTVTSLADDGSEGTLREEIEDANALAGDDTIVFQAGLTGTITLVAGDIEIYLEGLQIQGPGASQITVNGGGLNRIFDLYAFASPDESVSISGLTLTGGLSAANGGALYSHLPQPPELTIADSVITGNESADAGGAIAIDYGSLTVSNTTIANNTANDFQGGGAIHVYRTDGDQANEVVVRDSTISGNNAGADEGGGITVGDAAGGTLIERTTISGNRGTDGGGIFLDDDITAPVTIDASAITGNTSTLAGGGIYVDDPEESVLIQNSTISGNLASGEGGGVFFSARPGVAPVPGRYSIRNSTIAGNQAGEYGGGINRNAATTGPTVASPTIELESAIVADNSAPLNPDLGEDLGIEAGTFDLGFSLIENRGNATITETPAGSNLLGVNPLLGPLAANGGPTQTHLPAVSSAAIDAGTANGLGTDQRGVLRTFDASNLVNRAGDGTDIGAVERVAEGECKGKAATALYQPGTPITGGEGDDVIVGTDADDRIKAAGGKDTVCAGGGNDRLRGSGGRDSLEGEAGKDKAKGGSGKDTIRGGGGKDRLSGQGGADKLKGQAGKDLLKGGGGADSLKGGGGKDKLRGGPGTDKLNGGPGKDSERQ